MGATHQSVKDPQNPRLEQEYDGVRLAPDNDEEYKGLQHAFRLAVEAAISNPAIRQAIATEVENRIIKTYKTWETQGGRNGSRPWPFPSP